MKGSKLEKAAKELSERAKRKGKDQGPFGIEGIVLMIARNRRASGQVILQEDEDIVQDVYVDLIQQADRFDPAIAGLGAYAGRITDRKVRRMGARRDILRMALDVEGPNCVGGLEGWDGRPDPKAEDPSASLEAQETEAALAEFQSSVREAWGALLAHLKRLGRRYEMRVLHAVLACDGNRSEASRRLSESTGHPITVRDVTLAMERIRSFAPAKRLAVLHKLLSGKEIE